MSIRDAVICEADPRNRYGRIWVLFVSVTRPGTVPFVPSMPRARAAHAHLVSGPGTKRFLRDEALAAAADFIPAGRKAGQLIGGGWAASSHLATSQGRGDGGRAWRPRGVHNRRLRCAARHPRASVSGHERSHSSPPWRRAPREGWTRAAPGPRRSAVAALRRSFNPPWRLSPLQCSADPRPARVPCPDAVRRLGTDPRAVARRRHARSLRARRSTARVDGGRR
jgi:hypothetical protein